MSTISLLLRICEIYSEFIWIFIVISQLSPIVFSADPIGILEVQMHYQNIEGVVSNGQSCDSFVFNRLCDIFFEICLTEEGDPRSCNVFFKKTQPVRNTISVYQSIKTDYYTNKKLNMKIKALDNDHFSAPDELGEFLYSFFPKSVSSGRRIKEIGRKGAHPSTEMSLIVKRTCTLNHFGDECLLCKVPTDRGFCDSYGRPSCYPGYYGLDCSLFDGCRNATCASFATCRRIGESFICLCDDTSGERCEDGYDPCEKHICERGGTCVRTGEHMNFAKCVNCTSGWEGLHCERKLNACELETLKLGHPPCENGGHCIVNPTNNTISVCLCAPGWQGDRCDVSFWKASAVVTNISMCLLILITCCIIAIVCCYRIYILPKLKTQRSIELTPVKSKSSCELSRANNLYEVTQDQMAHKDISYRAILKQNAALVKAIPTDGDEYEIMLDQEEKTHLTSAAPELVEVEEDYESINHELKDSLRCEATSSWNNEYGLSNFDNIIETMKRLPIEGGDYEYLCECNPENGHIC